MLWGLLSVTVSSGGDDYDSSSALTVTGGGSTGGASGTLVLDTGGNPITVPITFTNLPIDADLIGNYGVVVNPGQACWWNVPQSSKTDSGFDIVLTPKDSSTSIDAGFIDVFVFA